MARARKPERDKAKKIWIDSKGEKKLKDIAKELGVSATQVRKWKSLDKWGDESKGNVTNHQKERSHSSPPKKNVAKALHVIEISDLTEKQKLFCTYYLQRYNATWAYQKAYGVKYITASVEGSKTLVKPKVKELIEQLKQQQQADLYLTADDILKEYVKQAFASLGDVMDYRVHEEMLTDSEGMPRLDTDDNPITRHVADVYLKPSDEIDWSVIQDIHTGKDGLVVKLYDKQKAMHELLDRLPEPIDTDTENDSFLGAINSAIQKRKKDGDDDD